MQTVPRNVALTHSLSPVYLYVCMYACMHVCMYACMHIYIYTYIHICIYTYIHIHISYARKQGPAARCHTLCALSPEPPALRPDLRLRDRHRVVSSGPLLFVFILLLYLQTHCLMRPHINVSWRACQAPCGLAWAGTTLSPDHWRWKVLA